MSIRAAIVGPTGYTGLHLTNILLRHPGAKVTYLASAREQLPDMVDEFPQLLGRLDPAVSECRPIDPSAISREADVAFLCLPHQTAMNCAAQLLDVAMRVIDLSADYRLEDPAVYEQTYHTTHTDRDNLEHAVYGLPELYRADLPGADLVANPGCYPTAAALGITPLIERSLVQLEPIIINAASGVTGAGRKAKQGLQLAEQALSYAPYGAIGGHRHQPEINQTLSRAAGQPVSALFVPHLLPVDQGILETIYLDPADPDVTEADLFAAFEDAYADEPFVRLRAQLPDIRHVRDTNYCDITVRLAQGKVIVFVAIDNLIKGAAGQAVQNMNLVFNQDETAGLL